MKDVRSRLEELDIKTTPHFVPGKTTHVVAGKRNTAKSLQALIHAIFVVDQRFLSALEYATAGENLDEPESLSPLEADFDNAWPDALEYLPSPGNEPNQRATELFAPDQSRRNVFGGYSFAFFDGKQFENLQRPLIEGGGKALCFLVEYGKTTGDEIAEHVKEAAHDTQRDQANGRHRQNVAIQVRFTGGKVHDEWAKHVQQQSMVILGQELIEQNEFLDAILLKDASRLLRPIPQQALQIGDSVSDPTLSKSRNTTSHASHTPTQNEGLDRSSDQPGPAQHASTHQIHSEYPPNLPQATQESSHKRPNKPEHETTTRPSRRSRLRGTTVRAFAGFSDDHPKVSEPTSFGYSFNDVAQKRPPGDVLPDQGGLNREMEVDLPDDPPAECSKQGERSKKRQSPPSSDGYNEGSMFPAQAAIKRRRLEEEKKARENGRPTLSEEAVAKAKQQIPKKKVKQINVEEALRKKRREEAEAEEDEEPMTEYLRSMTVDDMQNLAIIEDMEIKERVNAVAQRSGERNERWDERWNGRKNFKKFRRKGQTDGPRHAQTVIVPLEEVKNTDFGVQDDFWTERDKAREQRKKKTVEREREETTPSQSYTDAPSHQEEVPAELIDGDQTEIIDVDAPRTTRRSQRGQSQVPSTRSQAASRKRPASRSAAASTNKKQKKLNLMMNEEEEGSSEDEVPKFRFRKR